MVAASTERDRVDTGLIEGGDKFIGVELVTHIRDVRLPHRPLKLPMMRSGKDTQGAVSARTGSNTGHWYLTQELLCIASTHIL